MFQLQSPIVRSNGINGAVTSLSLTDQGFIVRYVVTDAGGNLVSEKQFQVTAPTAKATIQAAFDSIETAIAKNFLGGK